MSACRSLSFSLSVFLSVLSLPAPFLLLLLLLPLGCFEEPLHHRLLSTIFIEALCLLCVSLHFSFAALPISLIHIFWLSFFSTLTRTHTHTHGRNYPHLLLPHSYRRNQCFAVACFSVVPLCCIRIHDVFLHPTHTPEPRVRKLNDGAIECEHALKRGPADNCGMTHRRWQNKKPFSQVTDKSSSFHACVKGERETVCYFILLHLSHLIIS